VTELRDDSSCTLRVRLQRRDRDGFSPSSPRPRTLLRS